MDVIICSMTTYIVLRRASRGRHIAPSAHATHLSGKRHHITDFAGRLAIMESHVFLATQVTAPAQFPSMLGVIAA